MGAVHADIEHLLKESNTRNPGYFVLFCVCERERERERERDRERDSLTACDNLCNCLLQTRNKKLDLQMNK